MAQTSVLTSPFTWSLVLKHYHVSNGELWRYFKIGTEKLIFKIYFESIFWCKTIFKCKYSFLVMPITKPSSDDEIMRKQYHFACVRILLLLFMTFDIKRIPYHLLSLMPSLYFAQMRQFKAGRLCSGNCYIFKCYLMDQSLVKFI